MSRTRSLRFLLALACRIGAVVAFLATALVGTGSVAAEAGAEGPPALEAGLADRKTLVQQNYARKTATALVAGGGGYEFDVAEASALVAPPDVVEGALALRWSVEGPGKVAVGAPTKSGFYAPLLTCAIHPVGDARILVCTVAPTAEKRHEDYLRWLVIEAVDRKTKVVHQCTLLRPEAVTQALKLTLKSPLPWGQPKAGPLAYPWPNMLAVGIGSPPGPTVQPFSQAGTTWKVLLELPTDGQAVKVSFHLTRETDGNLTVAPQLEVGDQLRRLAESAKKIRNQLQGDPQWEKVQEAERQVEKIKSTIATYEARLAQMSQTSSSQTYYNERLVQLRATLMEAERTLLEARREANATGRMRATLSNLETRLHDQVEAIKKALADNQPVSICDAWGVPVLILSLAIEEEVPPAASHSVAPTSPPAVPSKKPSPGTTPWRGTTGP